MGGLMTALAGRADKRAQVVSDILRHLLETVVERCLREVPRSRSHCVATKSASRDLRLRLPAALPSSATCKRGYSCSNTGHQSHVLRRERK
jgi:hypothetical protein